LTQLRLNAQVAISAGDRFILRNATQEDTIGGGEVLDAHPLKHQKKRGEVAEKVSELADTGLDAAIRHEISKTPYGTNYTSLLKLLNIGSKVLDDALSSLVTADSQVMVYGEGNKRYFTLPGNRERICVAVKKALEAHHKAHPLLVKGLTLKGIMKGVEAIAAAEIPLAVLEESINEAVKNGIIAEVESTYVLPGLQSEFSKDDELTMDIILEYIGNSASPKQLGEHKRGWPVEKKRLRNIIEHLLESGRIVTTPGGLMFSGKAIEWIRRKVVDFLADKGEATVSEMREHLGTSRKFAIPLLQYFEDEGTIVRDGDVRRLKK
jgi:selenocysteine-specific elongation factor